MAATLEFIRRCAEALLEGETLIVTLLTGVSTDWDTTDHDFLADIAADRADGGSYADLEVTEPDFSIAEDVANDRVEVDMVDQLFPGLGPLTSDDGIIKGVAVSLKVTNDADSPLLGVVDVRALDEEARTPDGTDYPVRIGSEGLIHLEQA